MDRWKTQNIACKGGLNTSTDTLSYLPGEAVALTNYEPGIYGGYRRINGYTKYDTNAVPGTGNVLGVCVYNGSNGTPGGVIACRGSSVYFGTGSGWTTTLTTARTGAGRYMFWKYQNVNSRTIVMCDGVNPAAKWDGSTYTLINGTGAPTNPKFATWFNSALVLAGYTSGGGLQAFSISAPGIDTQFNGADGAVEISVHDNIVGVRSFRGTLYIFCEKTIWQLTGTSVATYAISPVATRIGCLAYDSIQEVNGDLVYLSADGIRTLTGTMKLNDVELGDLSKPIIDLANSVFITAGNSPDNICSNVVAKKNQYRLFYSPTGQAASNAVGIIGAIRPGKQSMTQFGTYISVWEWSTTQGIQAVCSDSDFVGGNELVVHGANDGFVYQQEVGNSFNGNNITSVYTTAPLQLEDTEIRKLVQKLTVYLHLEGNSLINIVPIYDLDSNQTMQPNSVRSIQGSPQSVYGQALYGTGVYSGSQLFDAVTNLVGSGKLVQIQFSTSDMNPPHSIQGISLQYRMLGRR